MARQWRQALVALLAEGLDLWLDAGALAACGLCTTCVAGAFRSAPRACWFRVAHEQPFACYRPDDPEEETAQKDRLIAVCRLDSTLLLAALCPPALRQ